MGTTISKTSDSEGKSGEINEQSYLARHQTKGIFF